MTIVVLLTCLLIVAVNVRWVMLYRTGGGLDIDEAGYIGYAIRLEQALVEGGVGRWLRPLYGRFPQAPFTMAAASWLMAATGSVSEWTALLTNSILNGLLLLMVYALGSRVYGRGVGLVAAIVVGTTPYLFEHARNFNFATAAALFLTATLYCYVRSDGMRRPAWVVMLGVCAGLMLLSRTMTLAFLPVMALAFLVDSLVGRTPVRRLLAMAALSLAVLLLVCGRWFLINGKHVFGYLISYGYGQHAAEYANAENTFEFGYLLARVLDIVYYVKYPHAVLFGVGLVLLLIGLVVQGVVRGGKMTFGAMTLLVVGLGFLVLLSSKNIGQGFVIPLLPPLAIAIVGATAGLLSSRPVRLGVAAVVVGCAVVVFVPNADRRLCDAAVDALGGTNVVGGGAVQCGGTSSLYMRAHIDVPAGVDEEIRIGAAWRALSTRLADRLAALPGTDRGAMFASRHILLNVNTVNLELIKTRGAFMALQQIDPMTMASTPEAYEDWLKAPPVSDACYVVSLTTTAGEFNPTPDPDNLRKALAALGYDEIERMPTPTAGQEVSIFRKPAPACAPRS